MDTVTVHRSKASTQEGVRLAQATVIERKKRVAHRQDTDSQCGKSAQVTRHDALIGHHDARGTVNWIAQLLSRCVLRAAKWQLFAARRMLNSIESRVSFIMDCRCTAAAEYQAGIAWRVPAPSLPTLAGRDMVESCRMMK